MAIFTFPTPGLAIRTYLIIDEETKAERNTLGKERESNPALQKKEIKEWMDALLEGMPKAPSYFSEVKQKNLAGVSLLRDLTSSKVWGVEEVQKVNFSNYFLLDIRDPESFATKHLKTAINIPLAPTFLRWAAEWVSQDHPLVLIANQVEELNQAIEALHLVGIDQIDGFLLWNTLSLGEENNRFDSFLLLEPADLWQQREKWEVVDVRTLPEWNCGHILGACHRELGSSQPLQKKKGIAFICGSGYRSSIAASLAQKEGVTNICNVLGGMSAWKQLGLPFQS